MIYRFFFISTVFTLSRSFYIAVVSLSCLTIFNEMLFFFLFQLRIEEVDILSLSRWSVSALFEKMNARISDLSNRTHSSSYAEKQEYNGTIMLLESCSVNQENEIANLKKKLAAAQQQLSITLQINERLNRQVKGLEEENKRNQEEIRTLRKTTQYMTGFIMWLFQFYSIELR